MECLLQVVPQHQLRPIYSCLKPVKQMNRKLIKEMNKNLDDHKQTIAWTLPFFKYWGIHYLINHLKSLTFNYIV